MIGTKLDLRLPSCPARALLPAYLVDPPGPHAADLLAAFSFCWLLARRRARGLIVGDGGDVGSIVDQRRYTMNDGKMRRDGT